MPIMENKIDYKNIIETFVQTASAVNRGRFDYYKYKEFSEAHDYDYNNEVMGYTDFLFQIHKDGKCILFWAFRLDALTLKSYPIEAREKDFDRMRLNILNDFANYLNAD